MGQVYSIRGNPVPMDYGIAVGCGIVYQQTRVTALGHNPATDIATAPEDVWEAGGLYPFPAAATQIEVLSSSASDAAAGTGCRTVSIAGLDANYNQISESLVMNGVTPVTSVNSYLRINNFAVLSAGSTESNVGDITLRVISGGNTLHFMRAGIGFGNSCVYTVPNGYTLFILSIYMSVVQPNGTSPNSAVFAVFRRSSTGVRIKPLRFNVTSNNPYVHPANLGIVLAQKTDFTMQVFSVAQNNTDCAAAMEGILIGNDVLAV